MLDDSLKIPIRPKQTAKTLNAPLSITQSNSKWLKCHVTHEENDFDAFACVHQRRFVRCPGIAARTFSWNQIGSQNCDGFLTG
jgi:hypothetical protein